MQGSLMAQSDQFLSRKGQNGREPLLDYGPWGRENAAPFVCDVGTVTHCFNSYLLLVWNSWVCAVLRMGPHRGHAWQRPCTCNDLAVAQ